MSRRRGAPQVAEDLRRARFEATFRLVYEPLQVYARRRTDAATADDVVAEALTVIWRRLDDVPDGLALPWAYGVTRRCLANSRRGEQRRAQLVDRLVGERSAGQGSNDGDGQLDEELTSALSTLSADDRELVRLWAWEQLQPREIAVVLDISPNAAAIRVHRAKQRLTDALARKSGVPDGHTGVGSAKEAP